MERVARCATAKAYILLQPDGQALRLLSVTLVAHLLPNYSSDLLIRRIPFLQIRAHSDAHLRPS